MKVALPCTHDQPLELAVIDFDHVVQDVTARAVGGYVGQRLGQALVFGGKSDA